MASRLSEIGKPLKLFCLKVLQGNDKIMNRLSLRTLCSLVALILGLGALSAGFAQEEEANGDQADFVNAHDNFAQLLKNTDNVLFKEGEREGIKFYTVVWEHGGEMLRINIDLKELGTYNGKQIFGFSAWTLVSQSEEPVPPAVIKAVATTNDRLTIGSVSCSDDFKYVFANVTGSVEGLTPGGLWLYFAYMNENAKHMRSIAEEAGLGS